MRAGLDVETDVLEGLVGDENLDSLEHLADVVGIRGASDCEGMSKGEAERQEREGRGQGGREEREEESARTMGVDVLGLAGEGVVDVHEFLLDELGGVVVSVGALVVGEGDGEELAGLDLLLEEIRLVEEKNDGRLAEPLGLADLVELWR